MLGSTPPSSKSRTGMTNATSSATVGIKTSNGRRITKLERMLQTLHSLPSLGNILSLSMCPPATASMAGISVRAAVNAIEMTTAAPIPTDSSTGRSNSSRLESPITLDSPAKSMAVPAFDCDRAIESSIDIPCERSSRNRLT